MTSFGQKIPFVFPGSFPTRIIWVGEKGEENRDEEKWGKMGKVLAVINPGWKNSRKNSRDKIH